MYTLCSFVSMLITLLVTSTESYNGFEDALSGCDLPPQFWCSSDKVAQKCQVEKQCRRMQEQLSFPVRLGVFYESLCPDSKNFIIHQLQTAYSKLSNITFLELIPYGNAKEWKDGKQWKFTCQHGPDECYGNLMHCAKKLGIDFAVISGCMNSTYGNEYEHDMAVWTESLQPKVTFVPWITLNSIHTDDIQKQAESDLLKLICDTYKGPKPEACSAIVCQC